MAKVRVHELAKDLNMKSKQLVGILKGMGLEIKNHMSTLEEEQADWVKRKLREKENGSRTPTARPDSAEDRRPGTKRATGGARKAKTTTRQAERPAGKKPGKVPAEKPAKPQVGDKGKRQAGSQTAVSGERKPTSRRQSDAKPRTAREQAKTASRGQGEQAGKKKGAVSTPKKAEPAARSRDYSRRTRTRPGKKRDRKKKEAQPVPPELISIPEVITVRELAETMNINSAQLMKKLMSLGIMATITQDLDFETVEIIASEYGVEVEKEKTREEELLQEIVDDEESLQPRPPVVTVMGHVDHGKTSLLDAIRETNVVSREAGGITQHIGAYQVEIDGERITFIDTPGHEAFTAMRARGAQATDIAILVVAADDGVMPQTVEAINHARAAEVPIIVAVNKIDKPDANPDRVKQQLTEYNLIPEEWGGDTIMVPVSAKAGTGIQQLLEMILLVAEVKELTANPDRVAEGVVIEGRLDKGRGPVATVLVQKGTLNVGDSLLCGFTWGKVRAMSDHLGNRVDTATPSYPVEVQGLEDVPMAGDGFRVIDEKVAKQVSSLRLDEKKREEQMKTAKVSLDDFFKQIQEGEVKELNLIIKGDVQGSIEALVQSLMRVSTDEVKVNVIHSGVGAIRETDVMLASASNAIIIGFNVRPDTNARKYAEEENIDVRLYRVIYEAIEDVKKAMAGLLEPEYREAFQGRAEVRAVFKVPKVGNVAGCYIVDGKVSRNCKVRVLRDGVILFEGNLASLKRFKDDAREVVEGFECGIGIEDFNDVKEGDIIEAYIIEAIPREL